MKLNQAGTTILLVEQNAQMALSIANRAYVLETGHVVKEGSADALMHDDAVRKAYLGDKRIHRAPLSDGGGRGF